MLLTNPETASQPCPIPPFPEGVVAQGLAVVPLLTLLSQVGILLVGRQDSGDFSRDEVFVLQMLAEHLISRAWEGFSAY